MRTYKIFLLMILGFFLSETLLLNCKEVSDIVKTDKKMDFHLFHYQNIYAAMSDNVIKVDSNNKMIYFFVRESIKPEEIITINRNVGFRKFVGVSFDSSYNQNKINSIIKDIQLIKNINSLSIGTKYDSSRKSIKTLPKTIELDIRDSINIIKIVQIDTIRFNTRLIAKHLSITGCHDITLDFSQLDNIVDTIWVENKKFKGYEELYKEKLSCQSIFIGYPEFNKLNLVPKLLLQNSNIKNIVMRNVAIEKLNDNDSLSEHLNFLQFQGCYLNIVPNAWCNPEIFINGSIIHDDAEYSYYKPWKQTEFKIRKSDVQINK